MCFHTDRSPDIDVDTDDDDNEEDQENWSNDELSDSEPMLDDSHSRQRNVTRSKVRPAINRVTIDECYVWTGLKEYFLFFFLLMEIRVFASEICSTTPFPLIFFL